MLKMTIFRHGMVCTLIVTLENICIVSALAVWGKLTDQKQYKRKIGANAAC